MSPWSLRVRVGQKLKLRFRLSDGQKEKGNHMSHSLNSLKGVRKGIIQGSTIGDIKGDTRSLDCSSHARTN